MRKHRHTHKYNLPEERKAGTWRKFPMNVLNIHVI